MTHSSDTLIIFMMNGHSGAHFVFPFFSCQIENYHLLGINLSHLLLMSERVMMNDDQQEKGAHRYERRRLETEEPRIAQNDEKREERLQNAVCSR